MWVLTHERLHQSTGMCPQGWWLTIPSLTRLVTRKSILPEKLRQSGF